VCRYEWDYLFIYFKFQECRSAGCHTLAEAKIHIEQKRKKEYELNAQKAKQSDQLIPNNRSGQKINRPMKIEFVGSLDPKKGGAGLDSGGRDSPKTIGHTSVKQWDDWDIVGLPGAELLSASVSTFEISANFDEYALIFPYLLLQPCSHLWYFAV
jgi:transcriptional adapter 2-alpha